MLAIIVFAALVNYEHFLVPPKIQGFYQKFKLMLSKWSNYLMEGFYLTIDLYFFQKLGIKKYVLYFDMYQVHIAFFITTFVHEL